MPALPIACLAWIVTVLAVCLGVSPALAQKRVALVIGNSDYRNVAKLPNPGNDAAMMSATFRSAKFDVVESRNNLNAVEMRRALRDFADRSRDADIAVVYFAGHGIEIDGSNFAIPIDAHLERDTDTYDEAVALDRILLAVEPAKQLRMVILDACRDNPFAKTMKRQIASRSVGRGLAQVEPTSPNTVIAFAAKAGTTASDGDGANSPFAVALANHITKPGVDIRRAFGFVRDEVLKATGNRQEPYVNGSLGGNDVVLVPGLAAPARIDAGSDARRDYELAERVGTKEAWEFFLSSHATGFYSGLARAQLNKIAAEDARGAAAARARVAEDERVRLVAEGANAAEQQRAAAAAKAAAEASAEAERRRVEEVARLAVAEKAKPTDEGQSMSSVVSLRSTPPAERKPITLLPAFKPAPLAALTPPTEAKLVTQPAEAKAVTQPTGPTPGELARLLQIELRRVGCTTAEAGNVWTPAAQSALTSFNRSARTKFDVKVASLDALEAVKAKPARVCPLVCQDGFRAQGESCVKITCRAGFELNDDDECVRIRPQRAKREPAREPREPAPARAAAAPKSSGQIICTGTNASPGSCRPVARGCRLEMQMVGMLGGSELRNVEVCR